MVSRFLFDRQSYIRLLSLRFGFGLRRKGRKRVKFGFGLRRNGRNHIKFSTTSSKTKIKIKMKHEL